MVELIKDNFLEVFFVLFILIGFPLLIILLPQKNDARITMNNMPGPQTEGLTDEEEGLLIKFTDFLVENLRSDFKDYKSGKERIDLRPKNYNVGPGYKGVVKRKGGKTWIYYAIGEWKKEEAHEEFGSQLEAYQHMAKELGLEFKDE